MLISVVDLLEFVVVTFAVMRVTRLIVWDKITLPVRQKILAANGDNGMITYLIHCIYCTGFWIAVIMVSLYLIYPSKILFGIYAVLAVAEIAPRVLAHEPRTGGQ